MEGYPMNGSMEESSGQCMDGYNMVNFCSWKFILSCFTLSLLTIAIILGNGLVIISVFLYRKLRKRISNWFIASLALADLVLGALVLPFSIAYEVMGYWVFGSVKCRIWLVMDVWVCTSSILHLCMISIDRYVAIAFPLRYPYLMTHRKCRVICFGLWLLAFIICFPALIDFSSEASQNNSTTASSMGDAKTETPEQCDVLKYPLEYTVYSAMGSFFIPSIIMSGFYIQIFLLTRKYLKQSQTGTIMAMQSGSGSSALRIHRGGAGVINPAVCHNSVSQKHDCNKNEINSCKDDPVGCKERNEQDGHTLQCDKESISRESSIVSKTVHDHQQTHCLLPNRKSSKVNAHNVMITRETRAAKTVGIIVGCFIACWTPFFICYLIQGITGINMNIHLFHFFIWIGYINSLLNPCIYALFSNDYRHAFKQILRCQIKRMKTKDKGVGRYFNSLYISSTSARTDTPNHRIGGSTLNNVQKQKLDTSDDRHSMI